MFFFRSYRHTPRRRTRQRLLTLALPLLTLFILTLPFYLIYKPPYLLVSYFAHRYPDILWHVPHLKPGISPIVALTIDDAPTEFTPEILRLLKENDAHATFFLIGDHIPGRESVMRDAVNDGHELGNHAMFDEPSKDLSDEELAAQIQAVQSRIQRIYAMAGHQAEAHDQVKLDAAEQDSLYGSVTAGTAGYFRPGSGLFTDRMRALVQRLGFKLVLGSVYPHDPQISMPWVNAAHVLSMVRSGSIIIVHDRRPWTVPMLKIVLPELKRRGYRIGTISELLKEGASSV
ncbi:chitin deacetylase CDA4 [Aspergillus lucknowensis]|uniref:chitin deacetylase n=1 Tax=Aspergillus lucknowensis TaxID=176173 RepID=A0ABR4LCV3_9EURO